mgnify:CR=1 FL=1
MTVQNEANSQLIMNVKVEKLWLYIMSIHSANKHLSRAVFQKNCIAIQWPILQKKEERDYDVYRCIDLFIILCMILNTANIVL